MDPNLLTPEQVALAPALVPHGDDRQFHERPVSGANCFSPGSNGLGLYYSEGPPDQTPPSLSASLPATPASWTSQTVSHGLHLQTVDAKPPWTPSTFDGVTPLTETGMAWPESLLLHNPDGSCHLASPPMQYHPETALSAPDLSGQRCSVSSSYPTASEDFGSDGGGPSYLTQRGDRGDCWPELNTFPSLTVSAPLESMSSEMPGISPGGSTVIDLYAFETMSYSCSSSALSSPVSQPAAPPKGKARAKSLPTRPTDGQGSYVSGRRVRKRRAKSATSGGNFICHICGLACSRNTNLQKHLNTHQRERIKDFVCTLLNDEEQQCDKRFERKADLRRHQKAVHEKVRDLVCPADCGYASSRGDTLIRHIEDGCPKRPQVQGRKALSKTRENVDIRAKPELFIPSGTQPSANLSPLSGNHRFPKSEGYSLRSKPQNYYG